MRRVKFRNRRVQRIWNGWVGVGIVVGGGIFAYGVSRGALEAVLFVAVLAGGLTQFLGWRVHVLAIRRFAMRKFRDAFRVENGARAREAVATLREVSAPSAAALLLLYEATAFALDERWAEAMRKLDAVDLLHPDARLRVHSTNVRAWCCAFSDRAKEALELAKPNIEAARAAKIDDLAAFVGTLGVAQHLTGDHEAATKTLETSLSLGGDGRATAIRELHLGDALRALRRVDEARGAYHRAVEAQPEGRWGKRAGDRLRALDDEPQRD